MPTATRTGPVQRSATRRPPGRPGPITSRRDWTRRRGPDTLNPACGYSATSVAAIRVPAGTTVCEGAAASQPLGGGGSILGGGRQAYIPRVDATWLLP